MLYLHLKKSHLRLLSTKDRRSEDGSTGLVTPLMLLKAVKAGVRNLLAGIKPPMAETGALKVVMVKMVDGDGVGTGGSHTQSHINLQLMA